MQSNAGNVTEYLETVPVNRKASLIRLRQLCLELLKGFEESMAYGMPSYKRNGMVEVAFNSQKNYIALYILRKDVLDRYRAEMKELNLGKGCIRYTKPAQMQFEVIAHLLQDTLHATGDIC